ncbi:MAG: hypothetical protein WAV10_00105 [Minisyncoccia bacterium]
MGNYKGVIIKESLENKDVFNKIHVLKTETEIVTEEYKTPWLKKWTICTVEIPEEKADSIAEELSNALDSKHNWYADFKNKKNHYVIFRKKIFKINRKNKEEYEKAKVYGISLGIPSYQVDFY